MEKFLSIPVTNEQSQLLSASNVVIAEQTATTTFTVTYQSGSYVTVTHAASAGGSEEMRDWFQNQVGAAWTTSWQNPVYTVATPPRAISAIVFTPY